MISIKEVKYKNFGKCLPISNDYMEVFVTVDIGPRIIKCNLKGKENMMFEDVERNFSNDVSSMFGEGKTWYTYGGHRIWLSPEGFPETYYPDNDKVLYSTFANGAEFIPPVQDVTGIQISVKLEIAEDKPEIKISHKIANTNKTYLKGSVWCLSVMAQGGTALVPQPTEDTGLLPNRTLVMWPYARFNDTRFTLCDKYITVSQDKDATDAFKFGINNTSGKSAYINNGQALVKYVEYQEGAEYPDGGCSTEVYTNNLFEELESLSPLYTLAPEESMTHIETWTLFDGIEITKKTDAELAKVAEKIF
ncbi:MAG: hypothetical protein IJX55_05475 [Clostridia bacterium]|nr:hypothetical protein [Clostridia bacterium]